MDGKGLVKRLEDDYTDCTMENGTKIDVRALRQRMGLTQEQLASRLGISKQRVSQLELDPNTKPWGPLRMALERMEHALDSAP